MKHFSKQFIVTRGLLLLAFLAGSWTGLGRAVAQDAPGKRVALLVGVDKYDKRLFNDLSFAERDVEQMAAVLERSGYEVHLLTGSAAAAKRATLKNIQAALETVLKERTKRDLLLIGLAGHGLQIEVTNDGGKLQAESFYCPVDAEAGNAKTMLAMGNLFDEINRRGGGRNLVLVDACREDPTRGRGMDGSTVKTLPEGVAVLFGCAAGQKTYETEKAGGGHGIFFSSVLDGLRGGARKTDEGDITWTSLVEYVTDHVETDLDKLVGKTPLPQTPNLVTNLRGRSPVVLPRSGVGFAGTKAGQEWSANGLKMKFCWCPAGKFRMGSPQKEPGRSDDESSVSVTLSRGFWLGQYEVTQEEWERIMHNTLRQQQQKVAGEHAVRGEGEKFPMYWVDYEEATQFCRKLADQEQKAGRLPKGWSYRLPTEAQWEYACRAGTSTATAFGDTLSSKQANFDGDHPLGQTSAGPHRAQTVAVGSYAANAWGFHDMHGNVWEWCRDAYTEKLPGGNDPEVQRLERPAGSYVQRGRSWYSKGESCRSARRFKGVANYRLSALGFRVALTQIEDR